VSSADGKKEEEEEEEEEEDAPKPDGSLLLQKELSSLCSFWFALPNY